MFHFYFLAVFCHLVALHSTDTYRAAVVNLDNRTTIQEYVRLIEDAGSKSADIVVFPEMTILALPENYTKDSVPCDNLHNEKVTSPAQYALSCAARDNNIYVVVCMMEHGEKCDRHEHIECWFGFWIYETQFVFDRTGRTIARYRKSHPFIEEIAFHAGSDGPVYFDTDFGVRFGLVICFDLFFTVPMINLVEDLGITDFVYSTDFDDSVPVTSLQVQQGPSEYFGVNLLAANNLGAKLGLVGSGCGVYHKGKVLVYGRKKTNYVLVADVPKIKAAASTSLSNHNYSQEREGTSSIIPISRKLFAVGSRSDGNNDNDDFPEEDDLQAFQATPGLKKELFLHTSTINCSVAFEIDPGSPADNPQWFGAGALKVLFVNLLRIEFCGLIVCGDAKSDCTVLYNPYDVVFQNTKTRTLFKSISIIASYSDPKLEQVPAYMAADDKDLFPEGMWVVEHDKENQIHHMESTDELDRPVLFAAHFGVVKP